MRLAHRLFAFNSSRHRLWLENAAFASTVPAGTLVLDAGAGNAPYRRLFHHARYESADFEKVNKPYAQTTYVCDLARIPVEASRFDVVVFNQVLEHVPEPKEILGELNRVLKPGGRMIYSGPFFYEEHEQPYDFYRYTQFGVRYLFETSGFDVERIDWLEGYFGTVGYQLHSMARDLPWKPRELDKGVTGFALAPVMALLKSSFAVCSVCFHWLETRTKYQGAGYPKNYVAVVRKAPGISAGNT